MTYISPVSLECTAGSLHLIWPWSNFISYGSLLSPVGFPYQISRKCWWKISSSVTLIIYYLFPSQLLLPFNQKLLSLSGTIGTSILSLLFIKSSAGEYPLERRADLYTKSAWYGLLPYFSKLFMVFTPHSASPLYSWNNTGCWLCCKTDTPARTYRIKALE